MLALVAAVPDGPDRVNDVVGWKISARSHHGLAGGQAVRVLVAPDDFAGLEGSRAAAPVDGPIDAAAAHQARIGGIDDGVDRFVGEVALYQAQRHTADFKGHSRQKVKMD